MRTATQLRKDLEIVRRAIKPNENQRAEEITGLLRDFEWVSAKLSLQEQRAIIKEVVQEYAGLV